MKLKSLLPLALAAACGGSAPPIREGRPARIVATSTFVSVYRDALQPGWSDYSWAPHDLGNPAPVSAGTASIAVTYAPWTGLNLSNGAGVAATGLDFLDLQVDGGAGAGQKIYARLGLDGTYGPPVVLGGYCQGGAIPAGAFARCQVPLTALGAAQSSHIKAVILQEGAGLSLATLYFDEVGFSAAAPPPPPSPPAAPAGLAAAAGASAVSLSWSASAGATGYLVYRGASASGPFAALTASPITVTSYADSPVSAGATYWYTATAVNAAGESAQAAPVSATIPLPPPPPPASNTFVEPFLWSGNHAASLAAGGTTVWWQPDYWDVRGDVAYNDASYLMTLVQVEKGFHTDIHKAASNDPTSAMMNNTVHVVGGDGSRGLATMHLDFEDILSSRLRNPMVIASDMQPGVVSFRAPRFVTTGHWWEISITPASSITAGEYSSVPAVNAGLAGPFGTGFAVNTTSGVGNGHTPPEDSLNFVFQGYPDVPCSEGWHVHPEVKASIGGTRYNVWTPVASLADLPPTDPSEIDVLYQYRLEFRPSGVDFYADWDSPGTLALRGHYPLQIPWAEVHVQLLGVAYQADHHPQAPCYQGQVREIHWTDLSVSPVKWAYTSVAPHDTVTANVTRDTSWMAYDLRDIQRFGPPTADGLLLPNPAAYDRYGSMAYASFKVWASAVSPAAVQAIDLPVTVTAAQAAAAEARLLYDIRYTGTAALSINGAPLGTLTPATTVAAAGPGYATSWVRHAFQFSPALLHAGSNTVHLDLSGQVGLDHLQLEFAHAQ